MMNAATMREVCLYLINRPVHTLAGELIGRCGRCVYVPGVGYIINDAELANRILRNDAFRSSGRGGMGGMITPLVGEAALINMDGERHRELKQHLTTLFSGRYVSLVMHEALGDVLATARRDLIAGKEVDLVRVAHQITNRMTCHMLGLRPGRATADAVYEHIALLAKDLTTYLRFEKMEPTSTDIMEARRLYEELLSYAERSYDEDGPADNSLIQRLKAMGLTFAEAKGLIAVILLAGTETVSAALPRIVALLVDTRQFNLLAADRALLPRAIDEGLRVVCASPAILRRVARDVHDGGVSFKQGRRAIILLYTIMKQKTYGSRPRDFDIRREIDPRLRHLWFGGGAHACLGAGLAYREIGAVLEMLLDLPGTIRVVRRGFPRRQSFPGYTTLILRLEAP